MKKPTLNEKAKSFKPGYDEEGYTYPTYCSCGGSLILVTCTSTSQSHELDAEGHRSTPITEDVGQPQLFLECQDCGVCFEEV